MASSERADAAALARLRLNLQSISKSIEDLEKSVGFAHTLPPWPGIQTRANEISSSLARLLTTMQEHNDLLTSTRVYPKPSFPGRTDEMAVQTLTRLKPEPYIDDWIEEARAAARATESADNGNAAGNTESKLTMEQLRGLWAWAGPAANRVARPILEGEDEVGDDEDDDEGDEGDEDEEMQEAEPQKSSQVSMIGTSNPALPPIPLEEIYRFASTGVQQTVLVMK